MYSASLTQTFRDQAYKIIYNYVALTFAITAELLDQIEDAGSEFIITEPGQALHTVQEVAKTWGRFKVRMQHFGCN